MTPWALWAPEAAPSDAGLTLSVSPTRQEGTETTADAIPGKGIALGENQKAIYKFTVIFLAAMFFK